MNQWMERALQLAVANVRDGGSPFGAVLVQNNEILSEGVNEYHMKHDISGHAEMLAIRRAQEILQTTDLSHCTMYASGEPCSMCLSAMYFSGIRKVHYSQPVDYAAEIGLSLAKTVYDELSLPKNQRMISLVRESLEGPELDAMALYADKKSIQGGGS